MLVPNSKTLLDAFEQAATNCVQISFVDSDNPQPLSYSEVWSKSAEIASSLQKNAVSPGCVVCICKETSRELVEIYLAVIMRGAIPFVVSTVSGDPDKVSAIKRLQSLLKNTGSEVLITDDKQFLFLTAELNMCRIFSHSMLLDDASGYNNIVSRGIDDIAIIQSSSGSTGLPTCIGLTNRNLRANIVQLTEVVEATEQDRVMSWLPWYHDMGLIGCFLSPMWVGVPSYFLKPMSFLRRPERWLYELTKYKATVSPAPNFAFEQLISRFDKLDSERVELSSWKAALCGAEPINPKTVEIFCNFYSSFGFSPQAFLPSYGMAEATVCISCKKLSDKVTVHTLDRGKLHDNKVAVIAEDTTANETVQIVGCGSPVNGTSVEILSESGDLLAEGQVGRIHIRGESVFTTTMIDGQEVARTAGAFDTGDLGYLFGENLFITGRAKDLIIINGKNYSSYYFEHIAEELSPDLKGRTLAFGASLTDVGEQAYLLFEKTRNDSITVQSVTKHIAISTSVKPEVFEVPKGYLPRTTSGKLKRLAAKEMFLHEFNKHTDDEN